MSENNSIPISAWAEDDRPREKLLIKGKASLSDAELLAILIGSGSNKESAVDLCKRILSDQNFNLIKLSKMTVKKLMNYKGIGEAKAISIVAAMELGKRRRSAEVERRKKIRSSHDVFEYFVGILTDLPHEEFWILLLNRANEIIKKIRISQGGVSGTVADPKVIFRHALDELASSIILCHNHPSGNFKASQADIQLTQKLVEGGKVLDIPVIDHIIIGEENYYSFADNGMI